MKHNQLGFNNFKSFGERIQMFSDKPIRLIYGENCAEKLIFTLMNSILTNRFFLKKGGIAVCSYKKNTCKWNVIY